VLPECPTEPCGTALTAFRPAVADSGSGAELAISQNFSDRLIADLANGTACALQIFIAAALLGLGGKFSSDRSVLLAVA